MQSVLLLFVLRVYSYLACRWIFLLGSSLSKASVNDASNKSKYLESCMSNVFGSLMYLESVFLLYCHVIFIENCSFLFWCHVYLCMYLCGKKLFKIFRSHCLQILNRYPLSVDISLSWFPIVDI